MFGKNIFGLVIILFFYFEARSQEFSIGIKYAPVVIETPLYSWNAFSGNRVGAFLQWKKNRNALTLGLSFIKSTYTTSGSTTYEELNGGSVYATYSYYFLEKKNWRTAAKIGLEYARGTAHTYYSNRDFPSQVQAVSPMIGLEGGYKYRSIQLAAGLDIIWVNWLESIYKPVDFVPYVALKFYFN